MSHEEDLSVGSSDSPFEVGTNDPLPTHTLVEEASTGSQSAADMLCRRFMPPLTAYARGRLPAYARGMLETDDLVQNALTNALRQLDNFQNHGEGSFLRYLKTAVMNQIRNEIRNVSRRPKIGHYNPEQQHRESQQRTPLDSVVDRETREFYEEALSGLSARDQDLVIAKLEYQLSYSEICKHMGMASDDAARMGVKRAIRKLAGLMKGRE